MATIVAVVVTRDCDQSAVSVGCYSAACSMSAQWQQVGGSLTAFISVGGDLE